MGFFDRFLDAIRLNDDYDDDDFLDEEEDDYDDDYVPTIADVIDSMGYDPTEWHFDEDNGWLDYYPEE